MAFLAFKTICKKGSELGSWVSDLHYDYSEDTAWLSFGLKCLPLQGILAKFSGKYYSKKFEFKMFAIPLLQCWKLSL